MLVLPESSLVQRHEEMKKGLRDAFNKELERILNVCSHLECYWILGKVRFPEEYGGQVGHVFMEKSDSQPPFIQDSFVYYVDNRRGTKELLWMSWKDTLRIVPTHKTVRVQRAADDMNSIAELMSLATGVKQRVADGRA
jgi:hypothetical protein